MSAYADTIDLADVFRTLRRRWRTIVGAAALGLGAGALVWFIAPPRFTGTSTVLIRSTDASGSLLSKLGMGSNGGLGGALLGSAASSPIETELQILQSREAAGEVVDSLRMQARVRRPRRVPSAAVLAAIDAPGSFAPVRYDFERSRADSFRVSGDGFTGRARQGAAFRLPVGTVTLAAGTLPTHFQLQVYDRDDAISLLQKDLAVGKAGGEVVRISYRGGDSLTASRVPNALLAAYFRRRHTTDRGVNQHRVEFLSAQLDTVSRQLSDAERALRVEQEATGVLDPVVAARLGLESSAKVREDLTALDLEIASIDQLLSQVGTGRMSVRQIVAYPTFIKSPGVSQILGQLSNLEAERLKLLAERTPADPDVKALTSSITAVEGQLVPIASAYRTSLETQHADLQREADAMHSTLATLPATSERALRAQRDVLRFGQIYAALQEQLVAARLAAIGEGGDVRVLDVADPPRKVSFPTALSTLGIGGFGGLLAGVVLALLWSAFGKYAHDPLEIERRTGIPAVVLDAGAPLFLGGDAAPRTLLLVPIDSDADTDGVARRLLRTATARGVSPAVLDLSGDNNAGGPSLSMTATPIAMISKLEAEHDMVVVRLPALASDLVAAALTTTRPVLLVATAGRVDRARLRDAVQTLGRLAVPCAGVVLSRSESRAIARA